MAKKVSEDKKNLVRKRHLQRHSVQDISLETGLSERTIRRYIKNIPVTPVASAKDEDTDLQVDYTTVLTKKEEALTKKIAAEAALYEDTEEGWTYHLTEHDDRIRQQGLWWMCIVYPDSAPEHWIEKLKMTGLQAAISPMHDHDCWDHPSPATVNAETGEIVPEGARYKKGDRKKAHWHVIIKTEKKTSWREMNALLQSITHCPYIQKCRSLRKTYEYFLHLNHPNKYQGYDREEIIKLNDFVIEPTKYEQAIMYDEIIATVKKHKYTRWTQVTDHYAGQYEYMLMLSNKPSIVTEILKDLWREQHPDGRVQRVLIVDENPEN